MKSFFKKLAFVMALAMVVSLAAPAAANAATALVAAHQDSKVPVTELTMKVGDEDVDLCFLGAAAGWRELERGWKVISGDAVTVDQNGLVKAVKNGTAIIEFHMEGYESAVVTVTVGETTPVVDVYAGYDLTGVKEVTLKFNTSVDSVKEADVELYRVFDSVDGEVEVFWPIDSFSAKDGKIVVSPFVQFQDGDVYRIKYNGAEYDFVADIPALEEITHVETIFGTDGKNGKAPQSDIEADYDEWTTIYLGYKLMYGTMDVTALYKNDVEVEYALVSPDEDTEDIDEILEFDEEGELVLFTTDKVVVQAVVTYDVEVDGEDVEKTIPSPGVAINPTAIIPYDFDRVDDWAFYTGTGDFSWNTKTVPAGEEGYYVVLKVLDTRGGVYVTDTEAYEAIKAADSKTNIQDISSSDLTSTAGYSFEFYSTNTDTFLINKGVDTDPNVRTYKAADRAVFYVELHKEDLNEDDPDDTLVDTVYAGVFEIGAPKTFTSINPSKTSIELMAMAEEASLTVGEWVGTPKHQYNNGTWTPEVGSGFVFNYEVKCDNSKVEMVEDVDYSVGADGVITITINAADIYEKTGKDGNFKFTVKEKTSGISTNFTVSIKEPKVKDGAIVIDTKNDFEKVKIQATGNQMAWIDGQDTLTNLPEKKVAAIELFKTSGGYAVGHHTVVEGTAADEYTWVQDADWKDATGTYVEGSRVVALLKDGKIVKEAANGLYELKFNSGGFTVQLAVTDETTGGVVYADAGTYTVAVYTVSRIKDDKVYKTIDTTATFRYTGNLKDVKLVDRVAVTTELDITNEADWSQIVADSFKFTLGGSEWKLSDDDNGASLITVHDPVIEGDHIIIKNITVKVPVDYKTNLNDGQSYYTRTIAVNMSVRQVTDAE